VLPSPPEDLTQYPEILWNGSHMGLETNTLWWESWEDPESGGAFGTTGR